MAGNLPSAMTLRVNGEQRELAEATSVAGLLDTLGLAKLPCAVEVNRKLVPKKDHAGRVLVEGDTVEVVTLVGGG